ncbi:unnamed protein product, partial [Peniophora sp. CBMAI 1063]
VKLVRVRQDEPLTKGVLRVLTHNHDAGLEEVVQDPTEAIADAEDTERIGPPPPSPPASEGHESMPIPIPRSASPQPIDASIPLSTSPEAVGSLLTNPNPSASEKGSAPPPSAWAPARPGHANSDSAASVTFDLPAHPRGSSSSYATSSANPKHSSLNAHPRHASEPDDSPTQPRLGRWNTTGGTHTGTGKEAARDACRDGRGTAGAAGAAGRTMSMRSLAGDEEDGVPAALADDIQAQADQIRRERHSKRLRGEGAAGSTSDEKADKVAVGNVIGEGHANYVLMYNMLTGIRIAVSRCQAKIARALTPEDFNAAHKYSFDIIGNELTPSAKYDFKFKDYAPFVFRDLRERHFRLDPADYLLSLTAKYILSELGSPGKSGSFFYFSRDYRFIIKTIHHTEHTYLRRILPRYYEHVKNNPHTLVSRFYGLHRVKLPRGRKIHFVIMNNLFPAHKDIHETYDLKGSTVGRLYPEDRARANPRAVLKDLNWISRGKSIELGPEKRALLTEQLRRDAAFLREVGVMDYSLLIGIHKLERGNRDNVRRNTLKVFSPDVPPRDGQAVRRLMRTAPAVASLPDHLAASPGAQSLFYQDEGGLRATDERNKDLNTIYYLGVIDILTPFRFAKKVEGVWKGLRADRHKISPVPPDEYADRFVAFMKAVMRGGGGATAFVASSDVGLLQHQPSESSADPSPISPDEPPITPGHDEQQSIGGGRADGRRRTSAGSRASRRSGDGSSSGRRSGEGALASPRGAAGARGGFGGMREPADPRGGYGEVAAAAMATGAPMPDNMTHGNGAAHPNGHKGFEKLHGERMPSGDGLLGNGYGNGDAEVFTSGANVRSGAHWKADGPQRREYIRRWS